MPIRALIEVLRMIDAGFPSTGSNAWIRKYGPFTLMSKVRFQPASSHVSTGASWAMPALTNRISSLPNVSLTAAASAF
jgi:hypothetical protein